MWWARLEAAAPERARGGRAAQERFSQVSRKRLAQDCHSPVASRDHQRLALYALVMKLYGVCLPRPVTSREVGWVCEADEPKGRRRGPPSLAGEGDGRSAVYQRRGQTPRTRVREPAMRPACWVRSRRAARDVAATSAAAVTSIVTKSVGSRGQCGGRATSRHEPRGSGESAEATREQSASCASKASKPTIQPTGVDEDASCTTINGVRKEYFRFAALRSHASQVMCTSTQGVWQPSWLRVL